VDWQEQSCIRLIKEHLQWIGKKVSCNGLQIEKLHLIGDRGAVVRHKEQSIN
jgi:hypothetical protein